MKLLELDPVKLGFFVQQRRKSLGYTQDYIATVLGKSRGWYTQFERGKRNINLKDYVKILQILQADSTFLLQQSLRLEND